MDRLRTAMEKLGLPGRDRYDLPSSAGRFPDGAHYRIEIAGVERVSSLEAALDEAARRNVVIHRVIATVGGATFLDEQELRAFAALARENNVEVIMTPGPRRFWDLGRQLITREGLVSGMRIRGSDNLGHLLNDIERCLDAGMRGFLVADEGVLWLLATLREQGTIPRETVFKVSVFAGHANPAGARVMQELGANSINPLSDLTLPMLASFRSAIRIPMDVYIILVNAMGGINRFYEAAEIARIAAPCYFKFEPGESEDAIYQPWTPPEQQAHLVREKVRYAAIVNELVASINPSIVVSGAGCGDLSIPQ